MIVIRNIKELKRQFINPVVTIGVFDGVHLGHRKVLLSLARRAKKLNGTSVVISIYPHPLKILNQKKAPPLLISLRHRINLIEELSADVLLLLKFTDVFSRLSARNFIKKILVEKIGIKEILVGKDFVFGKDKSGDFASLVRAGLRYGFNVREVPMVKQRRVVISSTHIRNLVTEGRLSEAAKLLGRPFSILGTVKKGDMRGRILGFPTANMDPHHEAIPPSGVYAVWVKFNKKKFGGILNIGRRPTFYKDAEPTIEVHIFNFRKSIYNEELEVGFVRKIREEKKFKARCGLVCQVRQDAEKAKVILKVM